MSATLAKCMSVIENTDREDEIGDAGDFLNEMGVCIQLQVLFTSRLNVVVHFIGCKHQLFVPVCIEPGSLLNCCGHFRLCMLFVKVLRLIL